MRLFEVRVLGPVEIVRGEAVVAVGAEKQRRLLVALASAAGQTRSTDLLVEALWGPRPPASAGKLLQVYVSQLRKLLTPAQIVRRESGYELQVPDDSLDAARFERLLEEGRAANRRGNAAAAIPLLRRALELWRGPAYGDFVYEDFVRGEAERLAELRVAAVEERLEAELALGRHADVLAEVRALAAEHPLRERLQAQAMLALYRSGRQSEALDVYRNLEGRLRDELGLQPTQELRELQRRILRHERDLAAAAAAEAEPTLPLPTARLLGRERELEELRPLLSSAEVRLVVLTGAGGSGKTRLALEAAREAATGYADGAAFVDLAPLRDPRDVLAAVTAAVGVPEQPGDPFETVAAALRPRELLLVVDNAEHLTEAAPLFVRLLARAPRLTVLVTSRIVLHLSGEHVFPVEPLADDAAVALFVQRAREAESRFQARAGDEQPIREICARLDGLPLAIELAATRVRTLAPSELLARLEPRLPLLAGGPRDLPARQQTLRATLEWSLDLLDADERRDLRRLSVFPGGWTLQAAERVCETKLQRLSSLVDQNLVRRALSEQGSRYSLLETVREIAAELLDASPDAEETRSRHADYVLSIVRGANLTLDGEGQQRFDVAASEHDNVRAALAWLLDAGEVGRALELAVALEAFWLTSSAREGARWYETLLAADAQVEPMLRLQALRALGWARHAVNDNGRARAVWHDALARARALGDEAMTASLLLPLANLAYEDAANAGSRGARLGEAERLAREALGLRGRASRAALEAQALYTMGRIVRARSRLEEAHRLLEQALAAVRAAGSRYWEVYVLWELGSLGRELGRVGDAELRHRESLALAPLTGDGNMTIASLGALARLATDRGDVERAGRLWGAVEATETSLAGRWELNRAAWEAAVVREDNPGFRRAREEGRGMSLADVVAYALQPEPETGAVATAPAG